MQGGVVVEAGSKEEIFTPPRDRRTERLLA
jgi:ABC-type microcin C transport system duplicated ATPase subunit YejF